MDERVREREAEPSGSPEGKVVGAVEPAVVDTVTGALVAAGIPADAIDVVSGAELEAHEAPFERDGALGAVSRFLFSLGEELNAIGELQRLASGGQQLIGVPVKDDEEMRRVASIMREHGARDMTHFGRWTITTL